MFRTLTGRPPKFDLPAGATDCHIHLFDSTKYKQQTNAPKAPEDATIEQYEQVQQWLGLSRVVVVQGNAYHKNNHCVLDALDYFGESARGVVAVDASITDSEMHSMHKLGVRGVRIMNLLQGAVGLNEMLEVNDRSNAFNWSMIVQFNGCEILEYLPRLNAIKGDFVIDHVGKFIPPVRHNSPEFSALLKLIDKGNCYVKIAGYYETSLNGYPDYNDVGQLVQTLTQHAPDRLIWGSNWPHNMATSAENYPDDAHLLDLVCEWIGNGQSRNAIFVDNPARLYGFT